MRLLKGDQARQRRFCFVAMVVFAVFYYGCKKEEVTPGPVITVPLPDTAGLRLLSSDFVAGNFEKNGLDTFYLFFNKKVQVKHIRFKSDYCLPHLKHITSAGGTTVKFYNFLCGGIGGSYPFEYSVTDSTGKALTDSITFHTFTRYISQPGTISSYFVSKDNDFIWIASRAPNRITCVGIRDTSYHKNFELSFPPEKVVFNYFNNRLYIIPFFGDISSRGFIYVMNPTTGMIEKSIKIPTPAANMQMYARDLAIGANGVAMVKVTDQYYSSSWMVMESGRNDTFYYHPQRFSGVRLADISMCFTGGDENKVYGLENGGSCRLAVLDCSTLALTELSTPVSPRCFSSYIAVNKKTDDVFMVNLQSQPYGQFMISKGVMAGYATNFDAYGNSEADFSYRAGEDMHVYYLNSNVIGIVDYSAGNILITTRFAYGLNNISTTTDGKYLVAMGTSFIKLLDVGMFYRNL